MAETISGGVHFPNHNVNKFIVTFREINTGESKDVMVQGPFDLKQAEKIVKEYMQLPGFEYVSIKQYNTIVKIAVEQPCLN